MAPWFLDSLACPLAFAQVGLLNFLYDFTLDIFSIPENGPFRIQRSPALVSGALLNSVTRLETCSFCGGIDMEEQQKPVPARHLTPVQREDISAGLEGSTAGPVSIVANASDQEAVCFEGEIASVLEEMGCRVKIDNAEGKSTDQEIPVGVEMAVADRAVRPIHAYPIFHAFRSAGVAIKTRINARLRKNNTLYIAVGPNGPPAQPGTMLEKWKTKLYRQSGWF